VDPRNARSFRAGILATVFVLSVIPPLLLSPGVAFAKRTIGISTPSFEFNVAPGGTGKGNLVITNDGDESFNVLVYASNQKVDAKGVITYEVPNRDTQGFANSPAMWLRLALPKTTKSFGNTPYIEMKPGDRVPVGFSFQTPSDTAAGDHPAVIFFEMFDLPKSQPGSSSKVSGRVGSRIRIRVQGDVTENVDAQPFVVRQFVVGDQVPYVFTVRNRGNVDQQITAQLAVFDSNEAEKYRATVVTESALFAGTDKEVSGVLVPENAWLGRYVVRLEVAYPRQSAVKGSTDIQRVVKERTIWVAPLWLIIIVIVIAGLGILWLMWRRALARARKDAAREKQAGGGADAGVAPVPAAPAEPSSSE
jgi:hypothetical protein